MRLWHLVIAGVVVVALTGCRQTQEEPGAPRMQPYQPLTRADTPPPEPSARYESDPYATDPLVRPRESQTAADTAMPREPESTTVTEESAGVRIHIVAKGDTFYKLARQYYNDQGRWRDIWDANQARVPDPDKLTVGTKLIIP